MTLLLLLALVVVVPLSFALVVPVPAMLRLVRRLGIWQANIAVEGLCYAVRSVSLSSSLVLTLLAVVHICIL